MDWFERGFRLVFVVLFGILFSGVFAMLALETAFRRRRDDRRRGRSLRTGHDGGARSIRISA